MWLFIELEVSLTTFDSIRILTELRFIWLVGDHSFHPLPVQFTNRGGALDPKDDAETNVGRKYLKRKQALVSGAYAHSSTHPALL